MRIRISRLAGISAICAVAAVAQTKLEFEVASIKPTAPDARGMFIRPGPGGGVSITNMTLKEMILIAWRIQPYQISGGPEWLDSIHYDVIAKPENQSAQSELSQMLQTLLEDRFQLKLHRETKELPGYRGLFVYQEALKRRMRQNSDAVLLESARTTAKSKNALMTGSHRGIPNTPPLDSFANSRLDRLEELRREHRPELASVVFANPNNDNHLGNLLSLKQQLQRVEQMEFGHSIGTAGKGGRQDFPVASTHVRTRALNESSPASKTSHQLRS
ncbi:MAG: peptidase BlaR1 [Bryobacterales bacterium]|nr:peptidase BlaR1 [Bryobacterales bacterium]